MKKVLLSFIAAFSLIGISYAAPVPDFVELSAQIKSARLSFAEPEDLLRLLDIEPGAVSIMGLIYDTDRKVRLLMDEDLKEKEYFGCHPCVSTTSIRLKMSDVLERYLPATGHTPTWVTLYGI